MIVVGIDLAGKSKNPTGICIFKDGKYSFKTLYLDEEIINEINALKPSIIAIDAPIMEGEPRVRLADRILKKYGAIPPNLASMKQLTDRGSRLARILEKNFKVIETFPTATAKIMGVYSKNFKKTAEILKVKVNNKHELDAYLCCIVAKMFLEGRATEVGDKEGKIVIPAVSYS